MLLPPTWPAGDYIGSDSSIQMYLHMLRLAGSLHQEFLHERNSKTHSVCGILLGEGETKSNCLQMTRAQM